MNVVVLLSSGQTDEWVNVKSADMDMELMGALVITEEDGSVGGVYAPGMWMKVEYNVEVQADE